MNTYTNIVSPSGICFIFEGRKEIYDTTVFLLTKTANGYRVTIDGESYEATATKGWHMECAHKTVGEIYLAHLNRALFTAQYNPMPGADAMIAALEGGETIEICHTYNQPLNQN